MSSIERFQTDSAIGNPSTASVRCDVYERWLSFLGRHLYTYQLSSSKEPGFQLDACSRRSEGFTLARFTTVKGRSRLHRGSAQINADNRDSYAIYMPVRGELELTQFGRTQIYGPYSSVLLSSANPISHTKLGDNDTICLLLPRGFVEQRFVSGEDMCARNPATSTGIRRLFADTIMAFQRDAPAMTDGEFRAAARLVGELALLAVSGSLDPNSTMHSVRASNLDRAKRIMRRRLGDADLTLSDVAQECGVSLRYLHELFHEDGRTARQFLAAERLQQARRMLETSSGYDVTVTSVSLACGFPNLSHFSAAFRRAFGLSPRDVLHRRE